MRQQMGQFDIGVNTRVSSISYSALSARNASASYYPSTAFEAGANMRNARSVSIPAQVSRIDS